MNEKNSVLPRGILMCVASLLLATIGNEALVPTAQSQTNDLAYAQNWASANSHPALQAFKFWTDQYLSATGAASKSKLVAEGVALARQRRDVLAALIMSDPARALASAVPAAVRAQIPNEIVRELETRISGVGEFSALCSLQAKGGERVQPIERMVRLEGVSYIARVYGRRASQTTKRDIPLHGIALDGVLALHESVLREFELGEFTLAAREIIDIPSATQNSVAGEMPVLAELGGKVYRFASREHFQKTEGRLQAAEAGIGPQPTESTAAILGAGLNSKNDDALLGARTPKSPYTEGVKKILYIRIDFSDLPGDPTGWGTITASYAQNLADTQVRPYFQQSSYGITSLSNTVSTQLYRMPQTAANYATNIGSWQLHIDARTAAATNYDLTNYDRIVVVFSWLGSFPGSTITFGGMAEVGGPNVWVNGEFDFRVVAHELGHTYGLWHGNLWQVSDGNPASSLGSSTEYGDEFDTMGANFANDQHTDFNPWFKNELNWIHDSQVRTVTNSGIYRINRFDNSTGSGILALKIAKDSDLNYWVGCRRNFTNNPAMQHGAYVVWGHNGNTHSDLLDMTTPGTDDQDAALGIGSSFTDSSLGITIRPVAEGGSSPNEYLDVQVSFGPVSPLITSQPHDQTVLVGQRADFSVVVTGSPAPRYRWERRTTAQPNWVALWDGNIYSGTATSTMTITNARLTMSGEQYRCIATNGTPPDATSSIVTLLVAAPPTNDNFAAALTLTGTLAHATGSNLNSSKETGEPDHAGRPGGRSVWWKWTPAATGVASLDTLGSDFDSLLAVYTGSSVSTLSLIASNDDIGGGYLTSAVAFNVTGGTTYWMAVDGFYGAVGSIALNLAFTRSPLVIAQPQGQTRFLGDTANLSVTAGGSPPLSYQWRLNGTNLFAATNSVLALTGLQDYQAGDYSVVVSNSFGSTISSNASLAVTTVAAWGENSYLQTNVLPGLTNVIALAGGSYHSLALKGDGTIAAWGMDLYGQTDVPADVSDFIAIGAGLYHSLALRANGTVLGWGANYFGQPTGLSNVVAIAVGIQHNVALKADGTIVAWGGDPALTQVPAGLDKVSAISAGNNHSLALKIDGSVVAWGDNSFGQTNVPPGLTDVVAIAAGGSHNLALRSNGTVIAWGFNYSGQASVPLGLSNVIAVAAGSEHSLALKRDGTLVAWGRNIGSSGNLEGQATVPTNLANVVAIAGGGFHTLALVGSPAVRAKLFNPVRKGSTFSTTLPTLSRNNYHLEYKNSLSASNWTSLPSVAGNGSIKTLIDSTATTPTRFYRAVVERPDDIVQLPAASGVISAPFVISGGHISQSVTTGLAQSGRAVYNFTLTNTGTYMVKGIVSAPNDLANSFYVNIDAEPQDPAMIWDLPVTSGFQEETLTWRSNPAFPKIFNLSAGMHQLIVRGREAGALLQSITVVQYP